MAPKLYGVIDAARDRKLYGLIKSTPDHVCLFAGDLKSPLERTAPYLIDLTTGLEFAQTWRRHWGEGWGIIAASSLPLAGLRKHLRRFLQVKLPDGQIVLFRFYDPRVFRTYFSTCGRQQIDDWFDRVDEFRIETGSGSEMVVYRARERELLPNYLKSRNET